MFENLKLTIQMWYDDFMFQYGPERLELARNRLEAHKLAMQEGYQSPYTDFEDYDMAWNPIVKRQKSFD